MISGLSRFALLAARLRCAAIVCSMLGILSTVAPHPARAQEGGPRPIVRIQSASISLPIQIAAAQGYFADEHLDVQYAQFTSARQAFELLAGNELEMLITSSDNPANYRLNPNNPHGALLDVQIIFGHDRGFGLSLVAQPSFATAESLAGHRIGVDDPASGFAITLYDILRRHGLEPNVDYEVVTVGGTPVRLAALRAGQIDAALINSDSLVRARSEGFSILANVSQVATPYSGGVAVARQSWLQANPHAAVGFIRGFHRALGWLVDPANRAEAVASLTNANTPPALAELVYAAAVDPVVGLAPNALLSIGGLLNVLESRIGAGGFGTPQDLDYLISPASELYDLSYYWKALGRPDPYRSCPRRSR